MRSFISMDIKSKEVLDKIDIFQKKLKNSACPMKTVEKENLHLTMKFLGEINEHSYKRIVESLEPTLKEFSSFEVEIKGTGFFPSISNLRVIWVGLNAPEIVYIQKEIEDTINSMGFAEDKKFVPHLTVSRIKSSLNKKSLLNVLDDYKDYKFGTDWIRGINFKMSTLTPSGPIYETLKEFKFKEV